MFGSGKTWFGKNFLNQLRKILEESNNDIRFKDREIDKLMKEIKSYPEDLKYFLNSKIIIIDMINITKYELFEEYLKDRMFEQIEFEISKEERKEYKKKGI
ncbi:hypothetical protein M0812_22823 [Anaeramoeba flamelloides]|uniref:Uncharacterized protein n=1 Tax=Anaeramoeba flamelloides TaxID=1746091 RepID=A0AAV7Z2N8_9EUKA|nr:hypothetical protein M0812_22823 [Anaeramoeba flamelloides]